MATIGTRNTLTVLKTATPGLYLDGGTLGEILLPRRYIPHGVEPGDTLDVFLYRDSEDRLVATTETPSAMVGEFACLEVLSVNPQIGAFLDWGLSRDLLLPFSEQKLHVHLGQWVIVHVHLDPKTNRIVASARWQRYLSPAEPAYHIGQEVQLLITGPTPLGYNAIVENAHRGLLYRDTMSGRLMSGQKLRGFVRALRPGGKIDLALDASGYQRVVSLSDQILQALASNGGRLNMDDASSPEVIRDAFGASKKAFKQALGRLYKERRIQFMNPGIELVTGSERRPPIPRTERTRPVFSASPYPERPSRLGGRAKGSW
jgi:predicted RNA-binding protein (virulence factor B family)